MAQPPPQLRVTVNHLLPQTKRAPSQTVVVVLVVAVVVVVVDDDDIAVAVGIHTHTHDSKQRGELRGCCNRLD